MIESGVTFIDWQHGKPNIKVYHGVKYTTVYDGNVLSNFTVVWRKGKLNNKASQVNKDDF